MKILIAMDSFKGSLSSVEAGEALKEVIYSMDQSVDADVFRVSDGGEGLTEALLSVRDHEKRRITVTGPLGNPVEVVYGIYENAGEKCAVMEMAEAAGLVLVPEDSRNPLYTTTYGVGQMICDAVQNGCNKIVMGIGGSATNDAGIGMLQALGYHFRDGKGMEVPFGAIALQDVEAIDEADVWEQIRKCEIRVACDVKNPLCGENGCSWVFSPQKGATKKQAAEMDEWMRKYADVIKKQFPKADPDAEGAGAAGGLGFAFQTFLNVKLERGIDTVLHEIGFEDSIAGADLVITGEGRLDAQTAMGKVPAGVAACAKKHGVKVIAFGGSVDENSMEILKTAGIDFCYGITPEGMALEQAIKKDVALENLRRKAEEVLYGWLE